MMATTTTSDPSTSTGTTAVAKGHSEPGSGSRMARAQRLKDLLLEKELRSEIATAEFALTLDISPEEAEELTNPTEGAIDYERLAEKLEKGLALIKRRQNRSGAGEIMTSQLTLRLNQTKAELEDVLTRVKRSMSGETEAVLIKPLVVKEDASSASTTTPATSSSGSSSSLNNPLTELVREDGSVEWDKAIEKGKDFAKFSNDLWERLSGKSPDKVEGSHGGGHGEPVSKPVNFTAIDNSPAIRQLATILDDLEEELKSTEKERDRCVGGDEGTFPCWWLRLIGCL